MTGSISLYVSLTIDDVVAPFCRASLLQSALRHTNAAAAATTTMQSVNDCSNNSNLTIGTTLAGLDDVRASESKNSLGM